MFITDFLKNVDKLTASMEKEELIGFIHNEARLINENKREDFLKRLVEFSDPSSADRKKTANNNQIPDNVERQLSAIYKMFDRIDKREVSLICEYNEEYDDWYDEDEDEYIYNDHEHIADTVSSACDLLHSLVDWECYDKAAKLSEDILRLCIAAETQDGYEDDFSFFDLYNNELISVDYEKVILDMLFSAYMSTASPKREKTVFEFMELSHWKEINLGKLMQHSSRELPQISEFIDHWMENLCKESGELTEKLLREAVDLISDKKKVMQYAERYCANHPCIYDELLLNKNFADPKEAAQTGMKAIDIIPVNYMIRSNVALMTAEYSLSFGDVNGAEHCLLEAFRSCPSAVNLLRLMTTCTNFSDIETDVRSIISGRSNDKYSHSVSLYGKVTELTKYYLSRDDEYILLFLLGDYMDVLQKGMKAKKSLGWSTTFLKCGIPLYLILMYEKPHPETAMVQMYNTVSRYMSFNTEEYIKGTQISGTANTETLFIELFRKTLSCDKLSDVEQKKIIDRLGDLIELRTQLILSGTKRNYYNECAAYIAALGEMIESRGEMGYKQVLLKEYKSKYPRHSAFIREMKSFGLK